MKRELLLVTSVCPQPVENEGDVQFRPRTGKAAATPLLPEVEAYLQLLMVVYLTNNQRYAEVKTHAHYSSSVGTSIIQSSK